MEEKNILFYFSGTGNSLMAAEKIASKMEHCEITDLSKFNTREKIEADRVGIICPVYFWGLPNIVHEFLTKLKIKADTYVFSVVTMGSSAGNTLPEIAQILKQSGNALSYGASLKCPDNYSTILGAQSTKKHSELLFTAVEQLNSITQDVKEKKTNDIPKMSGAKELLFGGYRKSLSKQDKKFTVNDSCNHCELCIKQCPVQNIRMEDGKLVWQHHCELCLSCISKCPTEAIQRGRKTKGKARYRNPLVKC